jgi:predicted secreted protein
MSITGGIILYVVIWFLTMFIVAPIVSRSQAEEGEVVPGTPEGAPANFRLGRTAVIVTIWTTIIFAVVAAIILSNIITVQDLDWMHVLAKPAYN